MRRSRSPFRRDGSERYLPWMVAALVFLATMSLAAVLLLDVAIDRWHSDLEAGLTIQVPAGPNGRPADRIVQDTMGLLRTMPAVDSAEALSRDSVAAMLKPWLGTGAGVLDLPLPTVIDLSMENATDTDISLLRRRLAEISPQIVLDDHGEWFEQLAGYASMSRWVAVGALGLVGVVLVVSVIFVALTRMAIHHEAVALLHLMGASDAFVAREMQGLAQRVAILGGVIGFALAAIALVGLDRATLGVEEALVPLPHLSPVDWILLAGVPVAVVLVAAATARTTVYRRLGRLQ